MSEDELRSIMDHMAYGLYIIGSKMGDGVNGMMADWVMQVSFKPRLLAVSFENDARTLANIKANRVFTVNFLSEGEEGMHLAGHFAQPYYGSKVHGPQASGVQRKLEGIRHSLTARGCESAVPSGTPIPTWRSLSSMTLEVAPRARTPSAVIARRRRDGRRGCAGSRRAT